MKYATLTLLFLLSGCQLMLGATYTDQWMDGEPDLLGSVRVQQRVFAGDGASIDVYAEHISSIPDQDSLKLEHAGVVWTIGTP